MTDQQKIENWDMLMALIEKGRRLNYHTSKVEIEAHNPNNLKAHIVGPIKAEDRAPILIPLHNGI